jgi:hypothetical protein
MGKVCTLGLPTETVRAGLAGAGWGAWAMLAPAKTSQPRQTEVESQRLGYRARWRALVGNVMGALAFIKTNAHQ